MSDTLSNEQIDAVVYALVSANAGIRFRDIVDGTRGDIFPNSQSKRDRACDRSLQRLRLAGKVRLERPFWHVL